MITAVVLDDSSWRRRAACRGLDPVVFHPSDGVGVAAARRVCAQCPVVAEGLEYALVYGIDDGVWGDASQRTRRRLRSARNRQAVA